MYLPQNVIRQKRNKQILTKAEIACFVDGLKNGSFTDAQVGSMAMAIWLNGMSTEEVVDLTLAMRDSGTVINWNNALDKPIVDKHSTGGVGDKVSLMLAPIVAACGAHVPMIAGQGLGHTGGTVDKLESIPGFNVRPSLPEFQALVKNYATAIISQTSDLAPADKRLYSIRDVTATVESIPLITASILSKKLAAGLESLVMDVKVGNGAMMADLPSAQALAHSIVSVANGAGTPTQALITDMNQPLGTTVGNALEIQETIDYLNGKYQEPRLHEITIALASLMLLTSNLAETLPQATTLAEEALSSGKAAKIFGQMITAMGGPADLLTNSENILPKANVIQDIIAPKSGYIGTMDTRAIGMALVEMGGGRVDHNQGLDYSVGFSHIKPKGSKVDAGDVIAKVHAKDAAQANLAINQYLAAIEFSDNEVEVEPVIHQLIQ
ncbi:thymidine phosphorylase [Thalassotalea piscium]|uniref:Thymidine phosphorylase n=1 Tax=Thalassotalea piscium TaxID=1230533 RepID=A0A7X0NFD0_9GAMM|nr:thymidine phosphorylase [Thalassotalea piscium]MBB6542410.1 thymidine phosphorylase [Thalassotalea piscium]